MKVCSFFAPRPDHPYFMDYTPFLNLLRESCKRFGHEHVVLTDDPGMGDDAFVVDLPGSLMRATLAAHLAWLEANPDEPTLLVGADCVLARDPVAFAQYSALFDLAITVGDFDDCRMNTGAIYIPRPARVTAIWADALAHCGSEWGDDQASLYAAIMRTGKDVVVRELPVDPFNLAPENPGDDCTRGVVLHFRGQRKNWMLDYCFKHLGLGEGVKVHALPNTDDATMLVNVRANVARKLPELQEVPEHDRHAVIVGGGPSLVDTIEEIRYRHDLGQTIFALNGTGRFLREHGIVPTWGVMMDPRPENAAFIKGVRPDRGWLLASQCHASVFDKATRQVPRREVTVWHAIWPEIAEQMAEIFADHAHQPLGIGGGICVGISAMAVAYTLGYRKLHLYGYDSSDRDDASHAYAQNETDPEKKRLQVWCEGKTYTCGVAMFAQAEAFPRWATLLADQGALITVHGDGLLPAIARGMATATTVEREVA